MDRAFIQQEEREATQLQNQKLKLCLLLERLRGCDNPNPFSVSGFWFSKYLQNLYCKARLSIGCCLRKLQHNDTMVVNNSTFCDSPGFLEGGNAAMEDSMEKNVVIEEKNEGLGDNEGKVGTFADLIEEKGRESSSSSDFLSSETTGQEEQSHSSSEESSSPPSMGWPIKNAKETDCSSQNGTKVEEKTRLRDKKQGSATSGTNLSLSLSPLSHILITC